MTDTTKPNDLTDAELDDVQGGKAVLGTQPRKGAVFDEARAVKPAPGGKNIYAETGDGSI